MKPFLKRAAIALAIVIALPFIIAAFMPRTFDLEREVVIDRPIGEVFEFVRRLENQKQYTVWFSRDPNIKTSLRGTDGTVGAVYTWESDDQNVGSGEQEIKAIDARKRIDFEIRIKVPFESADPSSTFTEPVGEKQTKVRSAYHGKMPYPMNLLCTIVKNKIGDDMHQSLVQLKEVLERPGENGHP